MHKWYAQAWDEDGPLDGEWFAYADNMTTATAKLNAMLDHLTVVELNIWRDDR